MTPAELRRIGETLYGPDWHAPMAYELGVAMRVVQRWANGQADMPGGVPEELRELVRSRALAVGKQAALYRERSDALDRLWAEMSGTLVPATDSAGAGN